MKGCKAAKGRASVCHPLPATCGRFPSPKMGEGLKSTTYKSLSPRGRDRSCSGNAARQRRITTRERAS